MKTYLCIVCAASFTTRRKDGLKMALRQAPRGQMSQRRGHVQSVALQKPTLKPSKFNPLRE